jgi:hypothetical protein
MLYGRTRAVKPDAHEKLCVEGRPECVRELEVKSFPLAPCPLMA